MGNDVKKHSIYNGKLQDKIWEKVHPDQKFQSNIPTIVRTTDWNLFADQYIFQLQQNMRFQNECSIYKQRASSLSENLVTILSAETFSQVSRHSVQHIFLNVKTQRISCRLADTVKLNVQEGLYILEGACNGYNQLLMHSPNLFTVTDTMIGLNQNGRVRVWLNSNFGKNYISRQTKRAGHPKAMFQSILEVVEKHLSVFTFPLHIKNNLLQANDLASGIFFAKNLLNMNKQSKKQLGREIISKNGQKNNKQQTQNCSDYFDVFKKNYHQQIIYKNKPVIKSQQKNIIRLSSQQKQTKNKSNIIKVEGKVNSSYQIKDRYSYKNLSKTYQPFVDETPKEHLQSNRRRKKIFEGKVHSQASYSFKTPLKNQNLQPSLYSQDHNKRSENRSFLNKSQVVTGPKGSQERFHSKNILKPQMSGSRVNEDSQENQSNRNLNNNDKLRFGPPKLPHQLYKSIVIQNESIQLQNMSYSANLPTQQNYRPISNQPNKSVQNIVKYLGKEQFMHPHEIFNASSKHPYGLSRYQQSSFAPLVKQQQVPHHSIINKNQSQDFVAPSHYLNKRQTHSNYKNESRYRSSEDNNRHFYKSQVNLFQH